MESRQVACQEGYTGTITEVRNSSCPDPYGQPIFGAWVESANSCVKSMSNVTNPVSPVSPINQPISTAPVVESATVEQQIENVIPSPTEVKVETEETIDQPKSPDVPKGKELVQGFGIVISLDIINSPISYQQQQLDIALDYSQELPDGIRRNQEFLTELISEGSATGIFDIGSKRWNDLYRHYEVQPGY